MDLTNKKASALQIAALAANYGYSTSIVQAICEVEGSGVGFNPPAGKIIIRFEPTWFKRLFPKWQQTKCLWMDTGTQNQADQWKAFNAAFADDPTAAMQSTSIGIMQVMGFHYKELGFKTVGEMWDFAKVNEVNQIELALRFCRSIPALDKAIKAKDYPHIAYYYNGAGYKELAIKTKSVPYDKRIEAADLKYSKQ